MILSGTFFAFVNNKNTNVAFSGKFSPSKRVIRFTFKHYSKRLNQALDIAKSNGFVTPENYNDGYYDLYFEDEEHNKYVFSCKAGGFSNNLDNGYFYKKMPY